MKRLGAIGYAAFLAGVVTWTAHSVNTANWVFDSLNNFKADRPVIEVPISLEDAARADEPKEKPKAVPSKSRAVNGLNSVEALDTELKRISDLIYRSDFGEACSPYRELAPQIQTFLTNLHAGISSFGVSPYESFLKENRHTIDIFAGCSRSQHYTDKIAWAVVHQISHSPGEYADRSPALFGFDVLSAEARSELFDFARDRLALYGDATPLELIVPWFWNSHVSGLINSSEGLSRRGSELIRLCREYDSCDIKSQLKTVENGLALEGYVSKL